MDQLLNSDYGGGGGGGGGGGDVCGGVEIIYMVNHQK